MKNRKMKNFPLRLKFFLYIFCYHFQRHQHFQCLLNIAHNVPTIAFLNWVSSEIY